MSSFCDSKRQEFRPKVSDLHCNGSEMKNPDDGITIAEMNKWVVQNLKVGADWQSELSCVWDSKKIAMIDYGDFLTNVDDDENNLHELVMRYVMTNKCGVRILTGSDSTEHSYTIYYQPDMWKQALLLYLFNENLIKLPEKGQLPFDIFQGILLGYTKNSIYEYSTGIGAHLEQYLKANSMFTSQKGPRSISTVEIDGWLLDQDIYQMWHQSSDNLKRFIYKSLYNEWYVEMSAERKQFEKTYALVSDFIEEWFAVIQFSPELKTFETFARGSQFLKPLINPSFGRRKSRKLNKTVKTGKTPRKAGKKSRKAGKKTKTNQGKK